MKAALLETALVPPSSSHFWQVIPPKTYEYRKVNAAVVVATPEGKGGRMSFPSVLPPEPHTHVITVTQHRSAPHCGTARSQRIAVYSGIILSTT